MDITRRQFGKQVIFTTVGLRLAMLMAAGSAPLALAGCDVITDIEDWVPIGEDAVNSVLALLGANGIAITPVITMAEGILNAALVALKNAAAEYAAVMPAPSTLLAKLQDALQAVIDNFGSFFTALGLPQVGTLASLVLNLIKLAVSTVIGFVNQLMAKASGAKTVIAGATFRAAGTAITVAPWKCNKRQFKEAWNEQIKVDGKGIVIPKTATMHVTFKEHFEL